MSRYCSNTKNLKALRKVLSKLATVEIDTDFIQGKITVIGYRKYNSWEEVDVQFEGKIHARLSRFSREWYNCEVLKRTNVSKIKVNRLIRKNIFKSLDSRLRYFSIQINRYSNIKKIKWI